MHHPVRVEQRRTRERVDAAREHELRAAGQDVVDPRVHRLHARGAVAHHGPAWNLLSAAHAQRRHPADVHFVDRGRGAAEDDFVELLGPKRLAHQERASGLSRKVGGGERPGTVLRLDERGARAVHDVDGFRVHGYAAVTAPRALPSVAISARPKSGGKSSTLITCLRSASFRCHAASSSSFKVETGSEIPCLRASRSFLSIGSPATAATNAASSTAVACSPFGRYMPAVSRSRVAPGSSGERAAPPFRGAGGGGGPAPRGGG